jgi:hypothetical protein
MRSYTTIYDQINNKLFCSFYFYFEICMRIELMSLKLSILLILLSPVLHLIRYKTAERNNGYS